MTVLKILSLCFLTTLSIRAENFSFMLSDAEQQALGPGDGWAEPANNDDKKEAQKVIFLSAILYLSPDKWALWLNDQVVHQLGRFQDVFIKSISSDHVVFKLGGNDDEEFLLKPNQSFIVTARKVVEGDKRAVYNTTPLDKPFEAPKHKEHETASVQGFKNE